MLMTLMHVSNLNQVLSITRREVLSLVADLVGVSQGHGVLRTRIQYAFDFLDRVPMVVDFDVFGGDECFVNNTGNRCVFA